MTPSAAVSADWYTRMLSSPAGPGIIMSLTLPTGSGSVGLSSSFRICITASTGMGCLRAWAGSRISNGLGLSAEKVSNSLPAHAGEEASRASCSDRS